jgi:hypothetical protein
MILDDGDLVHADRGEERLHLVPGHLLDRVDGVGDPRRARFLSLRWTTQAFAEEEFDGRDPGPYVRDGRLDARLRAVAGALDREPDRPYG